MKPLSAHRMNNQDAQQIADMDARVSTPWLSSVHDTDFPLELSAVDVRLQPILSAPQEMAQYIRVMHKYLLTLRGCSSFCQV